MKKNIVLLCFMLFVGVAHAQFEGQIDMKIAHVNGDTQRETQMAILIKQGMLAFTVKEEGSMDKGGNIIFRSDKNLLWIVNPKDKTYLEIVPDKEMMTSKDKSKKKPEQKSKGKSSIRKTGKSMTIAGYTCDEWVAEDEEELTTILGTTKLGNVYEGFTKALAQWGGNQLDRDSEGWQHELIEKRIFPMKTVTKERDEITETQEVTKVEQRSLATALFEPPAGYKKQALDFDMGKMMKGLNDGNTRSMSKDDLEKMMKQLKESMEQMGDDADSTKEDDEDDE